MKDRTWVSAVGFALLWIAIAIAISGTTFHLAPVIVAAAPQVQHPDRQPSALLTGGAVAVAAALGLSIAGFLDGPSLLPFGGALIESIAGAIAGGIIGFAISKRIVGQTAQQPVSS